MLFYSTAVGLVIFSNSCAIFTHVHNACQFGYFLICHVTYVKTHHCINNLMPQNPIVRWGFPKDLYRVRCDIHKCDITWGHEGFCL